MRTSFATAQSIAQRCLRFARAGPPEREAARREREDEAGDRQREREVELQREKQIVTERHAEELRIDGARRDHDENAERDDRRGEAEQARTDYGKARAFGKAEHEREEQERAGEREVDGPEHSQERRVIARVTGLAHALVGEREIEPASDRQAKDQPADNTEQPPAATSDTDLLPSPHTSHHSST